MTRVQNIFNHPDYQDSIKKTTEAEAERVFCRHGLEHCLSTARIAYIFSLERGYGIPKDIIYAAALLHDIGRWKQYRDGTPHHTAGAEIAAPILADAGFSDSECRQILDAIAGHRDSNAQEPLSQAIYDADKASRCCFMCDAQQVCNWSSQKKNLQIIW